MIACGSNVFDISARIRNWCESLNSLHKKLVRDSFVAILNQEQCLDQTKPEEKIVTVLKIVFLTPGHSSDSLIWNAINTGGWENSRCITSSDLTLKFDVMGVPDYEIKFPKRLNETHKKFFKLFMCFLALHSTRFCYFHRKIGLRFPNSSSVGLKALCKNLISPKRLYGSRIMWPCGVCTFAYF